MKRFPDAAPMLALTALLTARVVERLGVGPDLARLATGLAILTGPLAVYGTRAYLNAHLGGALLVALALHQGLLWLESGRGASAVAMGLAGGLACANRWQDAVIVAPLFVAIFASRGEGRGRALALAAAAAGLAGSIQLLAWQIQFGTPFLVPQGAGYMQWLRPRLLPLLFSTYHGLVPWNPGFALGLLGLALLALGRWSPPDRLRLPLVALAVGAALTLYVSACPGDWWGRDSFGPRRLTSLVAPVAVGLGALLHRLERITRLLASALLALWSVVAVSAHLSRWEDLGLLLFGRPGPFQPDGVAAMPSYGWVNGWGALHFLKPGFSLSDAPHLADRVVGVLVVVAVVLVLRLLWPLIEKRRLAQRALVAACTVYLGLWNVALATMPANREWDARWRDFLAAPLDPARAASLPPEMARARDVVISVRAAAAGDRPAMTAAVSRLRQAGVIVTEASLAAAAAGVHSP